MLKGVLFDLGHTLLDFKSDDWPGIRRVMNSALYKYIDARSAGHNLPPLDEFLEDLEVRSQAIWDEARTTGRGHSLLSVLPGVFTQYGIEGLTPEECLAPWYDQRATNWIYLQPGVKPTLELLRAQGLSLGVVSNTSWPAAAHDSDLRHFDLIDLLPCRIYSCDFGWEKPDPRIFHAALDCIGLRPEETAFVGDFLQYDVAGAHAVGMKAIWRRIPSRPTDLDDHTIIPDATIAQIAELPPLLQNLYNIENNT
jgi:HAD superfamily hydrolase (TIGR01509 family)